MTTTIEAIASDLAYAGNLRYFLEKARVATQVHLAHLANADQDDPLARSVLPDLVAIEDRIEGLIKQAFTDDPIWSRVWTHWAHGVKGAGRMVLGAVMSRADIARLDTVSSMWAHYGLAPGQKREAGKRIDFDPVGRTWAWRLARQLMMANGAFKTVYDQRKEYEESRVAVVVSAKRGVKVPDGAMTALHIHNRAVRYMLKRFMACLWLEWRTAARLPTSDLYIIGHDNAAGHLHSRVYQPQEYVER